MFQFCDVLFLLKKLVIANVANVNLPSAYFKKSTTEVVYMDSAAHTPTPTLNCIFCGLYSHVWKHWHVKRYV